MTHYEYRRYQVTPGKMDQLLNRFEETTLDVWKDVGIRPVGFWQSDIGRSSDLHYLLAWDDLGERADRLQAFRSHPAWLEARAVTEIDGPLHQYVDSQLWVPTSFSALQ